MDIEQIISERQDELSQLRAKRNSMGYAKYASKGDGIISDTAHQVALAVIGEIKKTVLDEHYKLEEWFAHIEQPSQLLIDAHQNSMRTRNKITAQLTTLEEALQDKK